MKKSLIIILFFIVNQLNSQTKKDKFTFELLENSFSKKELVLLNKSCVTFENLIDQHYSGLKMSTKYIDFLNGIKNFNLPIDIYKNNESAKLLREIKNSSLFEKIWSKYGENSDHDSTDDVVVITNQSNQNKNEQNLEEFFQINTHGDFIKFLIKHSDNEEFTACLTMIQAVPDISPGIIAGALVSGFKPKDFDSEIMKLYITFQFYLEFKLNYKNLK
jgi:hypothetical protein